MHTQQLTPKDLLAILKSALQTVRGKLGDDTTALYVETFMLVVLEPGIQQVDMPRALGVSSTSVVRNIANLGRKRKNGEEGPGFVEQRPHPDPHFRMRKVVHPTAKGLKWLDTLAGKVKRETGVTFDGERLAVVLRTSMSLMRGATDPDLAAYRMLILLCALEQPGLGQTELGQAAKITIPAAISRNVLNLTTFRTNRTPGPDFVEQRIDPLHRKENRIYVTIKAQHWFETVVERVNADLAKWERAQLSRH